ncbi:hypothetical protein PFISCL1PPCAC_20365, partial [Pristionchus fissidentatus]
MTLNDVYRQISSPSAMLQSPLERITLAATLASATTPRDPRLQKSRNTCSQPQASSSRRALLQDEDASPGNEENNMVGAQSQPALRVTRKRPSLDAGIGGESSE